MDSDYENVIMCKYVIYIRVSTARQGESGLGLEAQTKTCKDYITSQRGILVNSFCDVMSGTKRNRPELIKAVDYCKDNECTLVIAKLDRLARDCEFVFKIVNTGISIYFCDLPVVNTMILGVFASVAQYERELTSKRTIEALKAKKARGEKLGAANENYSVDKGAQEQGRIKASKARNGKTIHNPEFLSFCRILKRTSKVLQDSDDSLQGSDDLFMLSWMDYKAQVLKSLTRPDLLNILGQMRNARADNKDLFKSYTLDDSEHQLSLIRSKINNTFRIIYTYNKNNN